MALKHVLALSVAGLLMATAPAASAAELITIELPSKGNVDVSKVRFNGADHPGVLRANVLLPDGYDPSQRYPVLYLLHGAGEAYTTWVRKTKADEATRGLRAIVVMPDAATGFYTNWWADGRRGGPGWERYFLDEVIPAVERRFPIRPGRRWHAVAGFSMGGFGTAYLSSQRPDYFGAAGPMSGFLAPRRPEMPIAFDAATGQSYAAIYGPPDGAYVAGHDPVALAPNLRHTRLFVITGNGVPNPLEPQPAPPSIVSGAIGEADLMLHSLDFADAARRAGADVTSTVLPGIHDHPYWTDHLRRFLAWDPFAPVQEKPERWSYSTVADRGRAWELAYRFTDPPATVQTLGRSATGYSASGTGSVELCDSSGRGIRAALPFTDMEPRRTVSVRVVDGRLSTVRRTQRLRVALGASETTQVSIDGRVTRVGRSAAVRAPALTLQPGVERVVSMRLTAAARRIVRRGSARVRIVARHGTCEGGRWSTASRRLARR